MSKKSRRSRKKRANRPPEQPAHEVHPRERNKERSKPRKQATAPTVSWWSIVAVVGLLGMAVVAASVISARSSKDSESVAQASSPSPPPPVPVCKNLSPPALAMKVARDGPYPMTINRDASYEAEVTTSCGTLRIKLFPKQAPIAVNNFVNLAEDDFFTGLVFHRIDRALGIVQSGDPLCPGDPQDCGTGGPGYTIKDEFPNGLKAKMGTVAMASAGTPNSSGSQFEIVAGKSDLKLPPERTIFGQLVGEHSRQVASLILSVPTKRAPNAPPDAPADYSDGEFVYITKIKIIKT